MRFGSFEEMIRYYAQLTPDAPALRYEDGQEKRELSFAALERKIAGRAKELADMNKTCIGIFCDGSVDCVTEIFAAVKAGLQVVLLNENAQEAQITFTDTDLLWGDEDLIEEFSPALTDGVADGAGKILFFTSGTTSRNKAVQLTEKSLCASAYNGGALLALQPEDVLLCILPLDHVFGFVCGLLWGLSCGACVALGRGPRHYADDCSYFCPTAISAVPLLIGFLLQRNLLNPQLRLVLIGAGDCPTMIPAALKKAGIRVSFGYGLTETSSGLALSLEEDPYAMTVCPDDTVTLADDGEILVQAPTCIMEGYYKDPEATAAVLADGVLRTGDLGAWDENGKLHIIGRKKEMLVLSDGTKVFLPEYEQELSAVLPGREFAVIESEGFPALLAAGEDSEREALQQMIAPVMKNLPFGKQIRKIFFTKKAFPRTATGKIKRWALKELIEQ